MQRAATLDKGLDILEAILESRENELGVREISRRLGINPTTVHNLAWTLCERGYLKQTERTRRFVLGPACAYMAQGGSWWTALTQLAEPLVRRCQAELDESVMLAALDGEEIVSVVYIPSSQALRVHEPAVLAEHAYGTAVGKMLLSTLGEDNLEEYLRAYPPNPITAKTLATPRAIRTALAKIRQQGFAETHGELNVGVSAIAVLVEESPAAKCKFALGASAPTSRLNASQSRLSLESLKRCAQLIRRTWRDRSVFSPSTSPRYS